MDAEKAALWEFCKQSSRLKGTANVSYGKAGLDVTGLKECGGAPGTFLLIHSLIPAGFLLVPC